MSQYGAPETTGAAYGQQGQSGGYGAYSAQNQNHHGADRYSYGGQSEHGADSQQDSAGQNQNQRGAPSGLNQYDADADANADTVQAGQDAQQLEQKLSGQSHSRGPTASNAVTKQGSSATAKAHTTQTPAHSRFTQDPHHHNIMQHFHKVASEGLTSDHIHSFVHIGTLALSMLAKNSGMTAGHEPEDDGTS